MPMSPDRPATSVKSMCMRGATLVIFAGFLIPGCASPSGHLMGLMAKGPDRRANERLALFGQFVGDWDVDSVITQPGGVKVTNRGEWHFGWILGGAAVQDVFLLYASDGKATSPPSSYGTTVRVYNAREDLWHVAYVSTTAGTVRTFVAHQVGNEIVLENREPGPQYRWVFSKIEHDSFRWRSEVSPDAGSTWVVNQEMIVRRR